MRLSCYRLIGICLLILLPAAPGYAVQEVWLGEFPGQVLILGRNAGDYLGRALQAADFNDDGFADMILAAWGSDTSVGTESGAIYVIRGARNLASFPEIDLSLEGESWITVYGAQEADELGWSVIPLDMNGDGELDLAASGQIYPTSGDTRFRNRRGTVFLVGGALGGPQAAYYYSLSVALPAMTIEGVDGGDNFGWTLAAGDISGDGIDDLIVGAPEYHQQEGYAALILGRANIPTNYYMQLQDGGAAAFLYGGVESGLMGQAVAIGDVDGDGQDDLLIGAPNSPVRPGMSQGLVYIYYGPWGGEPAAPLTIYGRKEFDQFGANLVTADVNNDGIEEIIVSAPGEDFLSGSRADNGAVYILFPGPEWRDRTDIWLKDEPPEVVIWGENTAMGFGSALAAGDVNSDGQEDLLIGSPQTIRRGVINGGAAYLVAGGFTSGQELDVSADGAAVKFYGTNKDEFVGTAVACADVNGDDIQDMLIGAPGYEVANKNNAGACYLFFGNATLDFGNRTTTPPVEEETSNMSSGNSGPCFLATAAFGHNAAELKSFYAFRDRILLPYAPGKIMVSLYYRVTPPYARLLAKSPLTRAGGRILLYPFWLATKLLAL